MAVRVHARARFCCVCRHISVVHGFSGGELAGNSGLALREMEDTLVQRDGAVMGQARRTMGLKTALSDALGCAHHALWQSENHLTLTHVDASPAELMVRNHA